MSDRDKGTVENPTTNADEAASTGTTARTGSMGKAAAKPKRPRAGSKKAPEPTTEEIVDMVSEGGPVGDELDRQLGVTELPAETVEAETEVLERDHPELGEGPADAEPAAGDGPTAEAVATGVDGAVATGPGRRSRKRTAAAKGTPPSSSDPLVPGPGNPSPDGSQLAYLLTDATGSTRLWITALDGSSASSIDLPFLPEFDPEGPQWSPDGTTIALAGTAPSGIGTAIWLAPAEGGTCVVLADHAASDEQPRWSPDGTLIAFASRRHGRSSICVATPDGYGPVLQLTDGPIGQDDRNPCWEPNSLRIAYTRHMVEGEQAGEQVWTVSILTGEQKQVTKKLANRSQLQWCPGKSQIAFITDEAEWLNVGVVNPDNSAGWNLASEAGDKSSPRYSPDGTRIMYSRRVRGEVRLVERPTSGANAEPLDPGAGVATAGRWLPDKRVVYHFASATEAPSFVVQEAKKDVERLYIPVAGGWSAQEWFVAPDHLDYEIAGGLKAGVLVYRDKRAEAPLPAAIYFGPEPNEANVFAYDSTIQALVQHGFVVIVPTLPGTPGYGKKLVTALKERAGTEAEISDLVDLANWTRALDYVDGSRLSLVGQGYGGALALLLPGARPGSADAVAVVDPVTDWDDELDQADDAFAGWYLAQLGLPSANRGKAALRTPTTFAGVLDLPLLLVSTNRASFGRTIQLERFAAALDELGVPYARQAADDASTWEIAERVATFLANPVIPERDAERVPEAEAEPDEPAFVIEPVETVDIEALLIGEDAADLASDGANGVVVEAIESVELGDAEVESVERVDVTETIDIVAEPAAAPEPEREPVLASSNVGRGMRTDEI